MKEPTSKLPSIMPSFPLLSKELMEQANRKRTYIIRVIFIAVMGAISIMLMDKLSTRSAQGFSSVGLIIYNAVMLCQFFAVLIFLPGIMSTVITVEKERNSLELLFLTRMSSWEIVIQKYLSRVIPVLMFFFLGLPLLAIAYSFGGLDGKEVYQFPILILLAIFQIGALSLMFSAYFSTTVAAAVWSYLATMTEVIMVFQWDWFRRGRVDDLFNFMIVFLPVTTVIFLVLSIRFLKTRSFFKRKFLYMQFLGALDKFWRNVNSHFGGIEIIKDKKNPEPGDNPFEWYEKVKSPIGRLSYRIRFMLMLYVPVIFCLLKYTSDGWHSNSSSLFWFRILFVMYVLIAGISVSICGASAISAERGNQTLDIILTTPIPPREIVRQKMKRCRDYIIIFIIPVTVQAVTIENLRPDAFVQYIFFLAALFCIYLPLISWFSCWVGLIVKSHARAILVSLTSIAAWMAFPFVIRFIMENLLFAKLAEVNPLLYFSPTIPFVEIFILGEDISSESGFLIWSLMLFGLYVFLRFYCLENAERYLRQKGG